MKTDIYKIKTDQAWNRLYNRLDNDRLLAKVDEGHHTRKYSQWIRYGAVAAVLIGVIWGTLYWVTGSDKELAQHLLTQEIKVFPLWQRLSKTVLSYSWQKKLPCYIRNILLLINGK